MKKFTAALLAIAMGAVLLTGCTTSKSSAEATTETAGNALDFSSVYSENGTLEGVDAEKYVTLCDYSTFAFKAADLKASDDEIQTEINGILEDNKTEKQNKDRKIADGDTVNLDYKGFIDGKEFDGGSAEGQTLVIGSGSFIDDFEQQLIGYKGGDEVKVEVTFPEDYGKKEYAGKDATFECKINYISEQITPELTDEFVKTTLKDSYGYESVQDMKDKIADNLESNKKVLAVKNYLLENCKFEDITEIVDKNLDVQMDITKQQLEAQGYTLEMYMSSMGVESEDALREQYRSTTEEQVKLFLIVDAIAKKEGNSVTEEVLKDYFGGVDYQSYIDYYSQNYVNRYVLTDVVMDNMVENIKAN